MRRLIIISALLQLLAGSVCASAQNKASRNAVPGFLYESADPESDARAISEVRSRLARIRRTRPTVALVLSGGGAKGAAHVGVMKYLEEIGMPIDLIAGTSMGGLMGGMYALGYDAASIDTMLRSMDWNVMMTDAVTKDHLSFTSRENNGKYLFTIPFDYGRQIWNRDMNSDRLLALPEGLVNGYNVRNLITSKAVGYLDSLDFVNLPIPFFCVASDLASLKEYNWTRGNVVDALRSTMSIPVYFKPVRTKGMILTDGGTRNNFPVDIVRAMGADYIIGVDLHVDTELSEIQGMPSFISQLIDLTGVNTYEENIQGTDVHIRPNLAGFNMMSFDDKSIAQLIENGYVSACDHAGELDEIKRSLGRKASRVLSSKPASDIGKVKVRISEVDFEGLSDDEKAYFVDKTHIRPGMVYGKEEIEDELNYFYASGAFSDVTYTLSGNEEPYKLIFSCTKGAANNLNIGGRFDTEELVSVMLNVGLNANRLKGSKYEVSARLNNSPYLSLKYSYTPAKGYQVGVKALTGYSDVNMLAFTEDGVYKPRIREWHNSLRIFGSNTSWAKGSSVVGFELEDMPMIEVSGFTAVKAGRDWKRMALSAFYGFDYDSTDDRYFPTEGLRVVGRTRYMMSGRNIKDTQLEPYLQARISIKSARKLAERVVLLPSLYVNMATASQLYFRHANFIGGAIASRYYESQVPFIGYNGIFAAESQLFCADVGLRFKIGRKDYLQAQTAAYITAPKLNEVFSDGTGSFGFAFQYAHSSPIGPLKINLHWSSKTAMFGLYLSAGFDF